MKPAQREVLRKLTDPSGIVRSKALKSLTRTKECWFKKEEEVKLLFETLFRTYWMADSALQKTTIPWIVSILQNIVTSSDQPQSLAIFWTVFNNNWSGIDRYRLNKYYTLVDTIISKISDDGLLVTSEFTLKNMLEVKRPTGLIFRLSELVVEEVQGDKRSTEAKETLCTHVVEMITHCPSLLSFDSAADVVVGFASAYPEHSGSIRKVCVDSLVSDHLPSGSRPKIAAMIQKLQCINIPPAIK